MLPFYPYMIFPRSNAPGSAVRGARVPLVLRRGSVRFTRLAKGGAAGLSEFLSWQSNRVIYPSHTGWFNPENMWFNMIQPWTMVTLTVKNGELFMEQMWFDQHRNRDLTNRNRDFSRPTSWSHQQTIGDLAINNGGIEWGCSVHLEVTASANKSMGLGWKASTDSLSLRKDAYLDAQSIAGWWFETFWKILVN